jgi:hypothetical protein
MIQSRSIPEHQTRQILNKTTSTTYNKQHLRHTASSIEIEGSVHRLHTNHYKGQWIQPAKPISQNATSSWLICISELHLSQACLIPYLGCLYKDANKLLHSSWRLLSHVLLDKVCGVACVSSDNQAGDGDRC